MDMMALRRRVMANQAKLMTVSGDMLTFQTKLKRPLKSLKVNFSPMQEGSGDPSPDNVRPIKGWDGVTVHQSGKNLYNPNATWHSICGSGE